MIFLINKKSAKQLNSITKYSLINLIPTIKKNFKPSCSVCHKPIPKRKITSIHRAYIPELNVEFCTWKCALTYLTYAKDQFYLLEHSYRLRIQSQKYNKNPKKKIKKKNKKSECPVHRYPTFN